MSRFPRLASRYSSLAITSFNTMFLFVILNVGLLFVDFIKVSFFEESDPVSDSYSMADLLKVYPSLNESGIAELLGETWNRNLWEFEPLTQFKERPFTGRYVNVDRNGFRLTEDQGPWPPDPQSTNVFLFGGSTTFGYGVPDDQTLASYLQRILSSALEGDVHVYNFGRGFYYSTQERILFEKLLLTDFVPSIAIFVDGLNDHSNYGQNEFGKIEDRPQNTSRIEELFNEDAPSVWSQLIDRLPVTRAALFVRRRVVDVLIVNGGVGTLVETSPSGTRHDDGAIAEGLTQRYLLNRHLIQAASERYGILPIFVWQPIPNYRYDLTYHLFVGDGFSDDMTKNRLYQNMAEHRTLYPLGDNFLWCADIQESLQRPLYVDGVHYSAEMMDLFATTIVNSLLERDLLSNMVNRTAPIGIETCS